MSHEIDSIMLYIHPPMAIIGYAFIIFSLFLIIGEFRKSKPSRWNKYCRVILYLAWIFTLIGLATGMLWAQLAWGAYWTWDPKETVTLIIFILVCLSILSHESGMKKITLIMLIISIFTILVNIMITLGNFGLHSYGF